MSRYLNYEWKYRRWFERKKPGSGFREISSDDFAKGKAKNRTFILFHTMGHDANFTICRSDRRFREFNIKKNKLK